MAFRVAPVSNVNEITSHLLETQYVKLKMRQLKSKMVCLSLLVLFSLLNYVLIYENVMNSLLSLTGTIIQQ